MFKISKLISENTIAYPELRALKGKYRLTDIDMAAITHDKCAQTIGRKMECASEFSVSDMVNIVKYFWDRGEKPEKVTIQKIFFDWIFIIEKLSA